MKRKRFAVEQIVAVLKQAEAGLPVAELIRKVGVTEQTYYRWRTKYGGMDPQMAKYLKDLERENTRLKKLVADQALDMLILKEAARPN